MKNGFKVFDTDTHVLPAAEVIERYVDPVFRPRLKELEPYRKPMRQSAEYQGALHGYRIQPQFYRRVLGEAAPRPDHSGRDTVWMGAKVPRPGVQDDNAANRVADMDDEGTDVHFLVPGGWSSLIGVDDVSLETGMIRAFHRHMADFCGQYPDRLKGPIVASTRDVDSAVEEIRKWGKSTWAVAVKPQVDISRSITRASTRSGAPPPNTACRSCTTARRGTRPITRVTTTCGTTSSWDGWCRTRGAQCGLSRRSSAAAFWTVIRHCASARSNAASAGYRFGPSAWTSSTPMWGRPPKERALFLQHRAAGRGGNVPNGERLPQRGRADVRL
jgi:hypothetical protein